MIVIITKRLREKKFDLLFFFSSIKYFLKLKIQGVRGPQQVINNLVLGLQAIRQPYILNPHIKDINDGSIVGVIRDAHALRQIVNVKKGGVNIKIIAGPNIVVTPLDCDSLILNPLIDKIITPSQWVKEFYETFSNTINVVTWPVGVNCPNTPSSLDGPAIVYKKNVPDHIFEHTLQILRTHNIKYVILKYGHFTHTDFLHHLSRAPFLVYLQEIESQGIAMFEAWSYNVPTLVWNNSKYVYPHTNLSVQGNISAPYLTPETGLYFTDDFEEKLTTVLRRDKILTPRKYILDNFSFAKSAASYVTILHQ